MSLTRILYGEAKNAYVLLIWKPLGKRLLGRQRRSCDDNIIKMDSGK
jgi:hypothetical protein